MIAQRIDVTSLGSPLVACLPYRRPGHPSKTLVEHLSMGFFVEARFNKETEQ